MHTPSMEPRRRLWRKGLLLLGVLALLGIYFALGGHRLLTAEGLQANRDLLVAWVEQRPLGSRLAAVLVYAGVVALSIPVAALLSMTAGLLFGRLEGMTVVLLGATLGAVLVFLAARYLFHDTVQRRMGARLARLAARFEAEGFTYLLFLRLMPILPFWLVNLAPALTRLPVRTFAAATLIGIIPASFVYVNLGHTLGRVESPSGLVGSDMLVALSLIGVMALVPLLWRRFGRNRGEEGVQR
jgi:uncharacterized membrane protein YdjX (TVP38/TMEM64 family)